MNFINKQTCKIIIIFRVREKEDSRNSLKRLIYSEDNKISVRAFLVFNVK